jgi:hypothetical protein
LLAAALAHALGGCALALSGPAADRPRDQPPKCDTGKGLVVADAIAGSTMGLVTVLSLSEGAGTGALLPATIGAAFMLSAVSGNQNVNACRQAIAAYEGGAPEPLADEEETRRARAPGRRRAPAAAAPRGMAAPPARAGAPAAAAAAAPAPAPAVAPAPAPAATAPPVAEAAPPATAPPETAAPAPAATPARGAPRPAPAKAPPPSPAPPPPQSWVDFWRELP